jgi:hypothetical protein
MQFIICPTDFNDVLLAFIGGSDAQNCILLAKASGAKTAFAKEMLGDKAAYGADYSYGEGLHALSELAKQ